MKNWLQKKLPQPDPEALLREIAQSGPYSEMDRYRDFRRLFLETQEGKRVLNQILAWAHMWTTSMQPTPHETVFAEGERNIGLMILAALHHEPTEKPTKSRK